jgi:xyloglucan-specific exo-beta-1,4-glucanase
MKKFTFSILIFVFITCNGFSQVNWKNVSTQGMGYVDGLIVHPTSNAKYVRTDVGGIFRLDETTQRWVNLTDNLNTINDRDTSSVESFAIDFSTSGNNQVIYALCGNYGYKSYLLKSTNNGQTWTVNQDWNSDLIKVYGNGDWRCAGERIAIDPNNNSVVYVGTRLNGLWKTSNAAVNWNQVTSFTATGGNGGLPVVGGISFVVFDPSETIIVNSQTVSKNIYIGLIDGGVYRSSDGGISWCFLSGGFNIDTYNPVRAVFSNNRLIVALMEDGDNYSDGELWQFVPNSATCSGTWSNKTPGLVNDYDCPFFSKYMFNAVAVRPGFPNTVYAAIRGTMPRKIFYTENFEAQFPNWKILTNEDNTGYLSCIAQYQASNFTFPSSWVNTDGYDWVGNIGFDAIDNKKLWMTSGNGVMKIEDITSNPAQITAIGVMKDLEILCVNQIAAPPLPNTTPLYTATMDNLGIIYQELDNGTLTKLDTSFGLGAGISMDYSFQNPNAMVLIGQDYFNPTTINRKIKSTNGGQTWQNIWTLPNSCEDAPWGGNIAISSTNTNNFVWVPNNTSVLPECLDTVKNFPRYTTNGGTTWSFCNTINFPEGSFGFSFNSTFSIGKLLESDKVNGTKFYFYAMEGTTFLTKLWRTTDGGANWSAMSTGVLPITGSGQLKANPYIENDIWFAPFNTYILQNDPTPDLRKLWHSTDGGTTWTTLSSIDEVYSYGFGKIENGNSYASLIVYGKMGSVESIFISYDLGATFINIGAINIPEGIISNIEGDKKTPNRIYIATGCRGVWYGDVPPSLSVNTNTSKKLVLYPNPAKAYFYIQLPQNETSGTFNVTLYDLLGRKIQSQTITSFSEKINIPKLQKGTYLVEVESNTQKFSEKLVIE